MVVAKKGDGEGDDDRSVHPPQLPSTALRIGESEGDYRVRDVGPSAQVDELATLVECQLLARRDGLDDLPRRAHLCGQPADM